MFRKIKYIFGSNFLKVNMKNTLKLSKITLAFVSLVILTACTKTEPAVAKVYVRSASNQLVEGAQVVIIGDVEHSTTTQAYVDTAITNSSGFAQFAMDGYFGKDGAGDVGVFDLVVKKGDDRGEDFGFRVRKNNVAVRTVNFE